MIILLLTSTLAVAAPHSIEHALAFSGPNGLTYDARLLTPTGSPSGLSILLIGGGIGNDLEWSIPGTLEWNGTTTQMTIDGTSHSDAPRIAKALNAHGHAVMYFSTIAQEDPKRDRWPLEMTPTTPAALLKLAQHAANTLASQTTLSDNQLILVAHSMGAQRACTQAAEDARIKALVLLAAAQMTRTGPDDPGRNLHREAAVQRLSELDADGDGAVRGVEIPRGMDFDDDGELRMWELSAAMAKNARRSITVTTPDKNRHALRRRRAATTNDPDAASVWEPR